MQTPTLTVVLLTLTCLPAVSVAQPHRVQVTVDPAQSLGPISPYVFGAGIDAKTNPLRFPAYEEQVLRDVGESGLRMARYPGGFVFCRGDHRGSWTNFYWQDHIGKNPEKRLTEVYDLDTFVQFCERFGIEPLMQINFVGEPEESVRGYIEYLVGTGDVDGDGVNWAAKRAENGHPEPHRITYWQLGNEVHSYPQGFQENAAGAKEYAEALDRLVPIIRRMAPGAKIVVPLINIQRPRSEMKSELPAEDINFASGSEFTLAFLRNLKVKVDYFDWHFYPANGWGGSWPYLGTDNEWKHYYCWGTKFRECYAAIQDLIERECKQAPAPRILVGEWSGDWTAAIFPQYEQCFRGSLMRTMSSAVFMADILMFLMEKSVPDENIHSAFWHTFCNDAQALFSIQTTRDQGISYKGNSVDEGYGFRMPLYWVFKLLSEERGEELVEAKVEGDNTVAAPADGLYWDPEFSFQRVTCCATRGEDSLYVALLNKDAHEAVAVELNIGSWRLRPEVVAHVVGADSYLAENTIQEPERVKLVGPDALHVPDPANMTYRLPPNTLVVLRFERVGQEP